MAPYEASGRILPAWMWGTASAGGDAQSWAWPPRTAVMAGAPPVVGRWRIFKPAAFSSISIGK